MKTLFAFILLAQAAAAADPKPDAAQLQFFESRIRPVLADKCYECHSAASKKVKGGLLLDTRAGIRKGGDTGPAVVPGDLKASLLVTAIHYADDNMQMPPKAQLPAGVIADFEQWITMGAPDPREGAVVASLKMSAEEARHFWSFQPVHEPPLPEVKDKTWAWTDLDRFIRSAQEMKGVDPVVDADRMTLVRRIYFDLTGLPPTPQQTHDFVSDPDTNVLEKTVDKLLQSRQFGERWARYWLDIARYGESTGKERNYPFPEAWRYRDYVIAAFNKDMPYDEFVRQQIAGDLLPVTSAAGRNEQVIATGFLALGAKSVAEKNKALFANDLIDEQMDVVTRGFLGLTVSCARCHDHKFDPVTMTDYYAMAGIFRSTDTCYGINGGKIRDPSNLLPLIAENTPVEIAASTVDPDEAKPVRKRPTDGKGKKKKAKNVPFPVTTLSVPPGVEVIGSAMGVHDGKVVDSPLFDRGDPDEPRATVPRGLIRAIEMPGIDKMPSNASGRLQLAQWVSSPNNPLTARVAVNRIWMHLFGAGIVSTPDNFGQMGQRPSNQALLDHLAARFMKNGWSVKSLIREMVLSHTYQLSSDRNGRNQGIDPDNLLLWHASQRRLDAEAIRDAVLSITGQLDLKPPQGSVVSTFDGGDLGKERVYGVLENDTVVRSVYLPIVRNRVPEILEMFDFAEPSLLTASRDATNVPPQALFMLNGEFIDRQSNVAARVLLQAPMSDARRIDSAYWRFLCRPATPAEKARAVQFLQHMGKATEGAAERGMTALCQALFACAEFRYIK